MNSSSNFLFKIPSWQYDRRRSEYHMFSTRDLKTVRPDFLLNLQWSFSAYSHLAGMSGREPDLLCLSFTLEALTACLSSHKKAISLSYRLAKPRRKPQWVCSRRSYRELWAASARCCCWLALILACVCSVPHGEIWISVHFIFQRAPEQESSPWAFFFFFLSVLLN